MLALHGLTEWLFEAWTLSSSVKLLQVQVRQNFQHYQSENPRDQETDVRIEHESHRWFCRDSRWTRTRKLGERFDALGDARRCLISVGFIDGLSCTRRGDPREDFWGASVQRCQTAMERWTALTWCSVRSRCWDAHVHFVRTVHPPHFARVLTALHCMWHGPHPNEHSLAQAWVESENMWKHNRHAHKNRNHRNFQ